jgi:hypothetical protein
MELFGSHCEAIRKNRYSQTAPFYSLGAGLGKRMAKQEKSMAGYERQEAIGFAPRQRANAKGHAAFARSTLRLPIQGALRHRQTV